MQVLIALSICLQLICVGVALTLCIHARNGSWRFWMALTVAFLGIVLRRSVWLVGTRWGLNMLLVDSLSIAASYVVSVAFLAAMTEAALFHRSLRGHIQTQSDNIHELERRLGGEEHV